MQVHLIVEVGGSVSLAIRGYFEDYEGTTRQVVDTGLLERVVPPSSRLDATKIQQELEKVGNGYGLSGLYTRLTISIGGRRFLENHDVVSP